MIIDECKYMRDSHFVNSTELKEKYTYIHIGLGWKWHFFDNYDVIIKKKVGNALNVAKW